ncbi:hypothetical protein XENOCAPTIV_007045, partial [Xenoophorus captivus]
GSEVLNVRLDDPNETMPLPKSRKIAVLGYRSVAPVPVLFTVSLFAGKSSLTIQFVEGQFVDSYDPTIENTFTKTMTVNGQEYSLQLVDTAGQDEYSIFPESYTIDVNGYVLIYSVTSYKRSSSCLAGYVRLKLQRASADGLKSCRLLP